MWYSLLTLGVPECEIYLPVALLCALAAMTRWSSSKKCRSAPGPYGLPLVGHIPLLGTCPHETLTNWSHKYGPVYRLQFGVWPAVVVSGYKAVHEALVKQGDTFASRPRFETFQHYAQGTSISFSPYSNSLKLHRRVTSSAIKDCILSCMDRTEEVILREGHELVQVLQSKGQCGIDPGQGIVLAVSGILYSLCFGHDSRIREDAAYVDILTSENPATELFGAGNQVDLLPWSKVFRRSSHQDNINRMKKFTELNVQKCAEHDPMDVDTVLGYMMNAKHDHTLQKSQLTNTTVEFLSAGTETSSTTLLWLLLYMIKYPEVQAKVSAEIHQVIGQNRDPTSTDRPKLPYTEATVLEVTRLATIVPFALPHSTIRSTKLCGYDIPKDTLVFVNLWSVGRDPDSWENPHDFIPERFLVKDGDQWRIDNDRKRLVLAFGAGKRKCIGETLGKTQVFLLFTLLMQKCTFSCKTGQTPQLEVVFGDILRPKPYELTVSVK